MNLNIGKVIYELRKKAKVTQEQLANAVGVSVPAVSKWENNTSYPDITLLPAIARYFNTSIDELMSYDMTLSTEEIDVFIKKCQSMLQTQPFEMIVKECESYLHQYPNSLELKLNIGSLYMMSFSFLTEESDFLEMMNKAIALFEEAATSSDIKVQEQAHFLLASLYGMTEDEKKAEEVLLKIPKSELNRDDLLIPIYIRQKRYDEAKKMIQTNIMRALQSITLYLSNYENLAIKEDNLELAEKLLLIQPELVNLFDLERELGLSKYTLRYYEKEGLITPQRDNNGYRCYSDEDLQTLKLVKFLRSLNISIDDVKAIIHGKLDFHECLKMNQIHLDHQIESLKEVKKTIENIGKDKTR